LFALQSEIRYGSLNRRQHTTLGAVELPSAGTFLRRAYVLLCQLHVRMSDLYIVV